MTDNEKLVLFKARAGINDATQNELIGQYIKDAEYFILGVTGQASVPTALEGAQIDIAVGAWGKRGAEGEGAHSEGGVSVVLVNATDKKPVKTITVDVNAGE